MVCASTSSGLAAAASRAVVQVDALGALEHLRHRQARGRLGVGGVGVDELLVLRDRPVDVSVAECVLGGGVPRVDGVLVLALRVGRGRTRARLVAPGDALGGEALHHLGERRAQLVEGYDVLQQRHRTPVEDRHHQRDGRDLHGLGDLR